MNRILRDHERAVMSASMFEEGLLPIDNISHDMRRALDQLPKDEARKLKRRFRKVWRKLAKAEAQKISSNSRTTASKDTLLRARFGVGKSNPSRLDRENRKRLVQEAFYNNVVRPVLEKFENSNRTMTTTQDPDEIL